MNDRSTRDAFVSVSDGMPGNYHRPLAVLVGQRPRPRARVAYFFLIVFTALLFGRPQDFLPVLGALHLAQFVAVCAVIAYLFALLQGAVPFNWSTELKLMVALTVWFALGVPFSIWRSNSLDILTGEWLKTLLIFFLLSQMFVSLPRVRKLMWTIIGCEMIVSAISIAQRRPQVGGADERYLGIPLGILWGNSLGIAIGMTLPFMGALILAKPRSFFKSIFLIGTFLVTTWAVFLAASRSGLLCILVSLILTWLYVMRGSFSARLIGAGFFLSLVFVLMFAPGVLLERFKALVDTNRAAESGVVESAAASQQRRMELFRRSLIFTAEHPVFGVGLGNFIVASGTTIGKGYAWQITHNSYTEVSSEAGIPALLFYVGIMIVSLRKVRRLAKTLEGDPQQRELQLFARATFVSICAFMFGSAFDSLAYQFYLYYIIGIGIALEVDWQTENSKKPIPATSLANETHSRWGG